MLYMGRTRLVRYIGSHDRVGVTCLGSTVEHWGARQERQLSDRRNYSVDLR